MKFNLGKPKKSSERLFKKDMKSPLSYAKCVRADGFNYIDVRNAPFVLGGLIKPEENGNEYYRLDVTKKEEYSDANRSLANHTAGGCIRFSTNASVISIRVYNRNSSTGMSHFCNRGVWGIDCYVGTGTAREYVGKAMQTFAVVPNYNEGTIDLPAGIKEVQINLPLYGGIDKMEIGFAKGALIGAPTKRSVEPIAFYGSSITQGGCVSRPANSYANIVCRALDADCVNYGFSGSAMGELVIAEHIASRKLSCFVMDYDYNSPTCETLEATHEPFFKRIRELQPDLPVVFVTHPFYAKANENDKKRIAIVKKTYENALASGDKNVYFVDSSEFFTAEMRDLYSVDNLHPNDLGQFSMAETIYPVVKHAVGK